MERERSQSVQILEVGLVEPVVSTESASRTLLVSEVCGVSPLCGDRVALRRQQKAHICVLGSRRKYVRLIEC